MGEQTTGEQSEQDTVELWRAARLEEIGFDSLTALRLAMLPSVDIHRAEQLRIQRCPLHLIAAILA